MKKRNQPNMRKPTKDSFLVTHDWHKKNYSTPYRPSDHPVQEDWESVARKFNVDVKELIYFNYCTTVPEEVNYYLYHFGGFRKVSPSGNNYMFHRRASPGIIYIPPPDTKDLDFTPEEICVWRPDGIERFLRSLRAVAKTIPGEEGKRIKRLVQVITRVGHPGCLDLWYYNDMVVRTFVDIKTSGAKIKEMIKSTNETLPFDGESGLYGQGGPEERSRGKWRIHPVRDLFEEYKCGGWNTDRLVRELEIIDDYMFKGWKEMQLLEFKTQLGGGSAFHPLVPLFVDHVRRLAKDEKHLYWALSS